MTNLVPQILVNQDVANHLMTNMAALANHELILQEDHINLWKLWYINSWFLSEDFDTVQYWKKVLDKGWGIHEVGNSWKGLDCMGEEHYSRKSQISSSSSSTKERTQTCVWITIKTWKVTLICTFTFGENSYPLLHKVTYFHSVFMVDCFYKFNAGKG